MTVTVVTPVSPIKQHPEFTILRETLESVRAHLPTAEIVLMFDGVRPELEHRRSDYEEAIRRILWWCDKELGNVCPHVFDPHLHQVGMLRRVIDTVRTPLVLFVEQDTPLEREPIDWAACQDMILSGTADVVRFHHESSIPRAHKYLMRERQGDFLRTLQYSARPHLASVAYYKRALVENFSPHANTFLEDVLHSSAQVEPDRHKIYIYAPEGNMRRSYHLDGRAGEDKFEDRLVF